MTALLGVLSGQLSTAAQASFADTSAASMSVGTATLQPPTGLTATPGCISLLPTVLLTWTATTSVFATGYDVERNIAGVFTVVGSVSGRSTTSFTDSNLALATGYEYRVLARVASWSAASTAVTTTSLSLCV